MKKQSPISRLSSRRDKIKIYQSYGKGVKVKFRDKLFLEILLEAYKIAPKKYAKCTQSVEIHWVKSPEMKKFNHKYRDKNKATDVLSFESSQPNILGSLIIDLDTAKKQALDFGHSTLRELKELFSHGVFHLLGFDHETDRDAKIMKRYERKLEKFIDRLDHPKR